MDTIFFFSAVFITGIVGIMILTFALKFSFEFIKTRILYHSGENKDDFVVYQRENLICALIILCCVVALKEFYKLK